jgi:pyrophosphate--fructose-6-phosphate 1-phosphotransferase
MKGKYIELKPEYVNIFRNQGGFHMIGSGRDKIETPEQFAAARDVCEKLCLDGVVIIGGDDSNTNAAVLSEYLKSSGSSTRVIGCPKTIDGDLKTPMIETSFGFDTACKVYSEQISNLHSDALSSGKYYHFMRLMGRAASHITLECALQTHPNIALIGEEVAAKGSTLALITQQICDVICARASNNKHYGRYQIPYQFASPAQCQLDVTCHTLPSTCSVLVPEGLIEFIPEVGLLIKELNDIMATGVQSSDIPAILAALTPASAAVFQFLPVAVRQQLLLDRDSHGNVQVSKIETENLLIQVPFYFFRKPPAHSHRWRSCARRS